MSIPTPFNPLGTLGASLLPPGYTALKAVKFDNTQGGVAPDIVYVDTGFPATEHSRVESVMSVDDNSAGGYCGVYPSVGKQLQFGYDIGTLNAYAFSVKTFKAYDTEKHTFVVDVENRYSAVDEDVSPIEEPPPGYNTAPLTLMLGARKYFGYMISAALNMTLYNFKLFERGELVASFKPCVNPRGVCTLFDIVNKQEAIVGGNKSLTPIYL